MQSWAVLLAFLQQVASRPMRTPPVSAYTSKDPNDLYRTWQVRVAALVCSGVSTAASLLALYWFCRMDKRFRHQLIVLLFFGGLVSSTCYFVFAVLTSIHGPIVTEAASCQASGFLIQYGTETCDYAVLVMAIHSALQVFNPCPPATSDGLRPYRYYIYAGAVILPALMAGLAFANPEYAYQSLGAFCMLPIRPFWYRLALQWVPRYAIALTIFGLATAIYTYVGITFRRYSDTSQSIHDSYVTSGLTSSYGEHDPDPPSVAIPIHEVVLEKPDRRRRASSLAHEVVSSQRKESSVSFICAGSAPIRSASITPVSTYDMVGKAALAPPRRPSLALIPSGYTIHEISPPGNGHIVTPQRPPTNRSTSPSISPDEDPDGESDYDHDPDLLSPTTITPTRPPSPTYPGHRQMDRQRARIHRQLRLLFIYPLVYTLMWLIPFAMHCMNYRDKYALRPVWFVRLGSTILITSMGFVNFVVFTAREKPWKSIPTSDGTLWGSFVVWRGRGRGRNGSFGARASLSRMGSEGRVGGGSVGVQVMRPERRWNRRGLGWIWRGWNGWRI